ncbi:hypothetical protein MOMUL_08610 [Moorella mulderi DSM 14980]|uniref:Uncharacterized protein n=1 Tax=Moorella mulderi DSM 14980 TaxID=1122241 RepID=A0A151AZW7_9FIRM|nr:hypothetical protein MOMUL_08610 [Moorella mulderi DSM 14980]
MTVHIEKTKVDRKEAWLIQSTSRATYILTVKNTTVIDGSTSCSTIRYLTETKIIVASGAGTEAISEEVTP